MQCVRSNHAICIISVTTQQKNLSIQLKPTHRELIPRRAYTLHAVMRNGGALDRPKRRHCLWPVSNSNSTRARESHTLETRTRDTDPVRARCFWCTDDHGRARLYAIICNARRRSECMLLGQTYCVSDRDSVSRSPTSDDRMFFFFGLNVQLIGCCCHRH